MKDTHPSKSGTQTVLVITGFRDKPHKLSTHVGPLAEAAGQVDVLWPHEPTNAPNIEFVSTPRFSIFPLTVLAMCLTAVAIAWRREYDLIASFSLVPYGLNALVAGYLSETPTHLGIIGGDVDVHASAWYGPLTRWLFRQFDVVSVAGEHHVEAVTASGVPEEHVYSIGHPVDPAYAEANPADNPTDDLVWVAAMTPEKDPLLFVEMVDMLANAGHDISATMVGDGPLYDDVVAAVAAKDLEDHIDLVGWQEDPLPYYCDARIFVLTSTREMLPLSLVEAMSVGIVPVAASVGAVPDVVTDDRGVVVHTRDASTYVDAIESLLDDDAHRRELASRASIISQEMSMEAVADTWTELLGGRETPR